MGPTPGGVVFFSFLVVLAMCGVLASIIQKFHSTPTRANGEKHAHQKLNAYISRKRRCGNGVGTMGTSNLKTKNHMTSSSLVF
jgi:hypothetical protein